jgi:hypothetical protein
MDIPWNPAILEQRIARIHRLGQKKSVSVINFVSLKTIEHRMLSVLKFKTSLAQGILDNGESAIILESSKFNAFMKEVEEMTAADETQETSVSISDEEENREIQELAQQIETSADKKQSTDIQFIGDDDIAHQDEIPTETEKPAEKSTTSTSDSNPSELLARGFSFFASLAKTLSTPDGATHLANSLVEKDETTGQTHLKIPVESAETVANVLNMIGNLMKGMEK